MGKSEVAIHCFVTADSSIKVLQDVSGVVLGLFQSCRFCLNH